MTIRVPRDGYDKLFGRSAAISATILWQDSGAQSWRPIPTVSR